MADFHAAPQKEAMHNAQQVFKKHADVHRKDHSNAKWRPSLSRRAGNTQLLALLASSDW
ncbi:hypothetical protein RI367_008779, partial [Sorochytrium milnesiophthora]